MTPCSEPGRPRRVYTVRRRAIRGERGIVRRTSYFRALSVVRVHGELRGIYHSFRQRGKPAMWPWFLLGRRTVSGVRWRVRAALYMRILVATRYNPVIRAFYQKLLPAGEAKEAALAACTRKLLPIVNSLMKSGRH